jgi:hypothetical protein
MHKLPTTTPAISISFSSLDLLGKKQNKTPREIKTLKDHKFVTKQKAPK